MKLRFLLLPLFLLMNGIRAFAQQDASSAIPVCATIVQGTDPLGRGFKQDLTATNWDCYGEGEHNSAWYVVSIKSAGSLEFTIRPDRLTPAAGYTDSIADFDFMIWEVTPGTGPIGCSPLEIVQKNVPLRCNWAGLIPGGSTYTQTLTGISAAGTVTSSGINGPQFCSSINAIAGQSYLILIDQYDPTYKLNYKLDFTASTAVLSGTTPPAFASVNSPCGYASDNLIVTMDELIVPNSMDADGSDFYVTNTATGDIIPGVAAQDYYNAPNNPYLKKISLTLDRTIPAGNYVLHAKTGKNGNTLLGFCSNEQLVTNSLPFTLSADPIPLVIKRLDTPACNKARLILSRPVNCATIAADGSDFSITGPSRVSVVSANPSTCKTYSTTCKLGILTMADTIDLEFGGSIAVPGTYTITIQNGSDGNPITDSCLTKLQSGYQFAVSDKGFVKVDNISPLIICNPDYIVLSASVSPAAAVRPGFNWSGPYLNDSTTQYPTAYIPRTTSYTVEIMDTNACYRRSKLEVIVPIRHPELLSRDTAICLGDYVPLQIGGGVDYNWFPSTGLSCTNCPNPNASPTATTRYYGVVFDQYGCSDTVSTLIKVNPLPVVTVTPSKDTPLIYDQSVVLYALSPGGKYYTWEPVTGLNNANIPNPVATPHQSTRYTVYVTDTNFCQASATIDVGVQRDIPVFVPSGFTPNGDGRNDVFRVAHVSFQKIIEFRVFNRWGEEVYNGTDNKGWDGTLQGKPQDVGNYKYVIRVALPDGRTETYKGDVTLIR